ncbi:denn domain-containing protein 5b, partial [Quercus suber]
VERHVVLAHKLIQLYIFRILPPLLPLSKGSSRNKWFVSRIVVSSDRPVSKESSWINYKKRIIKQNGGVLTLFAAALLEKQIVVVCSNLGILSASVLSIIPLIRPYQWQSLLMPVLPNDMLDFLDAPVPYIVGVKNKTNEVQSKLTNVILLDVNKNQVKSPSIPQLPKQRELFSLLSPYHAKLVGESYLGKKRPVYECTEVQVSLLLKESFIDSFPSRDRPFMKLFVDTQLFSVHTDLVLSFIQKE